ncbi:uncharacterized protein LOC116125254 [Pistacia vera]|uniref:uncharacterized protein LOC116125254 n=1 Tax=Pistacia vera TaxID=55513 RepID=UPI001262EF5A|nr:uncharacterized protein LOC116125254 [Pistacia vera]
MAMDANNGIFLVAITICEIENKESWRYFMTLLKEFIGDIDLITIISDRQKGLVDVIQTCWSNASARYCARHVYANFRKKFLGLRNLFWAVSRVSNIIDFQQAMEKVEAVDREAHRWMIENDVRSWSRHSFDLDSKSDHVTNNMCEVFNSWLGENRELPILSLLEHYRRRVMVQMQARANARNDWITTVPPTVHRKINGLIESARNVKDIWPGSDEFEVNLLALTFVVFALFREGKLHQPQQVRHVNIKATVKGSRYFRSVELKHAIVFWCDKIVQA